MFVGGRRSDTSYLPFLFWSHSRHRSAKMRLPTVCVANNLIKSSDIFGTTILYRIYRIFDIFGNSTWRSPPSWMPTLTEFGTFAHVGSCLSSTPNLVQIIFTQSGDIDIFRKSRWQPPPSLIFTLNEFGTFRHARMVWLPSCTKFGYYVLWSPRTTAHFIPDVRLVTSREFTSGFDFYPPG